MLLLSGSVAKMLGVDFDTNISISVEVITSSS